MKRNDLLGTSFDCDCGRHHSVPTKHFFYSADAFDSLVNTARDVAAGTNYLVLADSRTFQVAGSRVEQLLYTGGAKVRHFIVPDREGEPPVTDDRTRDLLLAQAPPADLYVAVGSGVINDLGKWIAYLKQKPYIIVATAASMNGYASANVSATIEGLKILFHAEACQAVFAIPEIIETAPFELTTSGLGDVLAKPVSSADWKLNQFLFDDYYCQFSVDLLKELEPVYLNHPEKIKEKSPQGIQALFEALFFSSIAMTITGTSAPASGGEHLISHTIDMLAGRDGTKHDLHGRQVGVSSILMAALYEKVLAMENPTFKNLTKQIDKKFWGSLSPVIEKEYVKKQLRADLAQRKLSQAGNWDKLRDLIRTNLVSASKLKNCLAQAGAAHRFQDIRYNGRAVDQGMFVEVVKHANQMRDKFSILDLAFMVGFLPDGIESLIEEWVTV
jgi:glycerol-1-phosphate dehydrogenase [NAD(P)+]